MSSSNSITTEKQSADKVQRSESFSEKYTPLMGEEREIHKSKSLPKEEHVVDMITSVREIRRSKSVPKEERVVDITSVSVFRVPKALSETKPEAYEPRKVGLGLFHHFRRDLYLMRRKKLDDVVDFVDTDKDGFGIRRVQKFLTNCKAENVILGSYGDSLNMNHTALKQVIATDSIYLLNCLRNRDREDTDLKEKILTGDILMLENQIPGDLVLEIWKILKLGEESALSKNISTFCEQESPLKLTDKRHKPENVLPFLENGHLLSVLYNLILQREIETHRSLTRKIPIWDDERKEEIRKVMRIYGAAKFTEKFGGGPHSNKKSDVSAVSEPTPQVDFAGVADAISGVNLHGAAVIQKELSILQKIPWGKFMNKLKNIDPDREENTDPVEEIQIPSVSLLTQYAGVRFEVCKEKGIKNIKFDKNERTLYLPRITLTSNSEVVLRNLLAYEAAIAKQQSRLEFAEYVDLMCGIVDTPEDVRTLRGAKIIAGDLRSAEIAGIFNGIWRSTGDGDEEESSNIGVAIKEVDEFYGSRFNVRMRRFVHRHIYESWKLLAVISSVVALMLLALQAFCEIYDCNKHWFGGGKYDLSGLFDRAGSFSSM